MTLAISDPIRCTYTDGEYIAQRRYTDNLAVWFQNQRLGVAPDIEAAQEIIDKHRDESSKGATR